MRSNAHWYNVTAFDERKDFYGERRVTFKLHMDIDNYNDIKTAREIALNKIYADEAATYEDIKLAAIVMNFSRQ